MIRRFARVPRVAALVVVGAVSAACAGDNSVEVKRAEPIEVTDAPDTTSPPDTADSAPPPTDTEPNTTPPTDAPVDELVAAFEETMASGGEHRPGGPAPRDPTLDDAASAHAASITADGDVTSANSESLYAGLAESGTYVDLLANSALWSDEAAGTGDGSAVEEGSSSILSGFEQAWAASPDLLAYGIGGDGTTAVLVARFAPFTNTTEPAASDHFEKWVDGLSATGVLPILGHDQGLDAVVAHYFDDAWDPTLPVALGGTVAVSNEYFASYPPADVASPPVAAFLGEQHLATYSALRHPNATRYGMRWLIAGPGEWRLQLLVVGAAPSPEQAVAVQTSVRAGALADVNAVRVEGGLTATTWDPAAQAEAERIAAILAERQTIEETVRTDWDAWFWEDLLLPSAPYVGENDVMDAVGGKEASPTLGFATAQGANGLYYYVMVG